MDTEWRLNRLYQYLRLNVLNKILTLSSSTMAQSSVWLQKMNPAIRLTMFGKYSPVDDPAWLCVCTLLGEKSAPYSCRRDLGGQACIAYRLLACAR